MNKYLRPAEFSGRRLLAISTLSLLAAIALFALIRPDILLAQAFPSNPQLDPSKPVPTKDEVIAAWKKRQDSVKTFKFAWTEKQLHPKGWMPNPRYAEHEWLEIPGLTVDRTFAVSKTLTVDGSKMSYSYELERKDDPDDPRTSISPDQINHLGLGKTYRYTSTFDGKTGKVTLLSLKGSSPPQSVIQTYSNVDAQTLDTRPILMTYRPLDPVMGHVLISRAVTNGMRTFSRGKSTFLLEEQRDPSGWKSIFRIEPERAFLVTEMIVPFEYKPNLDMEIDYVEDTKWGWVPSAWRVTELLADGTKTQVVEAKVTSYSINQPVSQDEFK